MAATKENPERHTPGSTDDTTRSTNGGKFSHDGASVNGDGDSQYSNIPAELKELRQWVAWKLVSHPDGKKPKKVPVNPTNGRNAAVDDPLTWGTFAQAVKAWATDTRLPAGARWGLAGIGFMFTRDDPYCGIDLDGCRNVETGALNPLAHDTMQRVVSYTEASPSGTGIHIIAKGTLPAGGGNNGTVEMYDRARYFTCTGEHLGGTPTEIAAQQEAVDALYAEQFPEKLNGKAQQEQPKKTSAQHAATWRDVAEALPFIPAVEHDVWLHVGMALHSVDSGTEGFALWVAWSKRCPEKFDLADCHKRWRSFTPEGGVTEKTIFGLAIDHGWKNTAGAHATEEPEQNGAGEAAAVSSDFHLTDLGNGERFVATHGTDFLYCPPWKKWLGWDGTRWQRDETQMIRKRARDTVRGIYLEAGTLVDRIAEASTQDEKKQLLKQQHAVLRHAVMSENAKRVSAMLDLAQMDLPILPQQFDTDLWALNVENGTLDLRTGDLRPHRREDFLTKYVPLVYDPDAPCPLWEQFLSEIMGGNDDLVAFIWKAIGYSLTGDVREDCLFLLYGLGANGKSTFLKILRALFAEYSKQAAFSTFLVKDKDAIPNDLAALQGARLVVASETEEGKRMSMSVVKALTGRENVPARFLFSEFFEYPPQMKVWLGANHKPVITGTDHAIWRRIRLIPFTQKFEGTTDDKELGDKLLAELPGILAWAVRGCLEWQAEGLPMPEAVEKATAGYRAESDVMGSFLAECCRVQADLQTSAGSLLEAFKLYSGDKNCTHQKMKAALEEKGFLRRRSSLTGLMMWQGIGLLASGEKDDS